MIDNVTVVAQPQNEGELTIAQLRNDVEDSSLKNMNLGENLDYVENREETLHKVLGKLRYDGFVHILGTDFFEVARCLYTGHISIEDATPQTHGGRKSLSSIFAIKDFLQARGYEIQEARLDNIKYYVKAKRVRPS